MLDNAACIRAVRSRDPRFDGWFFVAVVTTGIYCRPSCPATPPRDENMVFHASAASAQRAGFRACKRCRPDAAPGSPEWDGRADVVARAMRLIADGVVDREGVGGLSRRLGYSERQLERQLGAELGAGPLALARAQRAQTARVLIETTDLAFGEVAFAAGFSSIRQFNETVRQVFALAPGELRSRRRRGVDAAPGTLCVRLPLRSPITFSNLFGHLVATAVPGVERWHEGAYERTLALSGGDAVVSLRPESDHVSCRLRLAEVSDLPSAVARCRRLLDLDADPVAVDDVLSRDPALAGSLARAPGRRVPRSTDGEEFAVRALVGQQVSTAAARTHARRLVERHGRDATVGVPGLGRIWPDAARLCSVEPATLAMPGARRASFAALVGALALGEVDLDAGSDRDLARRRLASVRGVGPWTIEMIAMRALGDPDAFPASDLGVRAGAAALGLPSSPAALLAHAEAWRPWRAYAVQHLWAATAHAVNSLPAPSAA